MIQAFQNNVALPFEWRLQRYEVVDTRGKTVSRVLDLLYDEKEKAVRYVITDIGGGVGVLGKRVLLPVEIVERAGNGILLCKVEEKVLMDLPPLENREKPTQEDERRIYEYFERKPYWQDITEQPEQTERAGAGEASTQTKPEGGKPPIKLELEK